MSRHNKRHREHLLREIAESKPRAEAAPAAFNPAVYPAGNPLPSPAASIEETVYRVRTQIFELSRGVGSSLAEKELEGGVSLEGLARGAAKASSYADQMIATLQQRYKPALECKAGCSYCCRKPGVLVTVAELLRILEHVQSTFSETEAQELAMRSRAYAAQMEGRNTDALIDETVPCPLLVEERCSVYEVRPLVCRGYNSTSAEACQMAHDNSSQLVPIFAPIKDVTDGATVGLTQQLKAQRLNDAMLDLGRALNIAFTSGEDLQQGVISTDSILALAENKAWAAELLSQVRAMASRVGLEI